MNLNLYMDNIKDIIHSINILNNDIKVIIVGGYAFDLFTNNNDGELKTKDIDIKFVVFKEMDNDLFRYININRIKILNNINKLLNDGNILMTLYQGHNLNFLNIKNYILNSSFTVGYHELIGTYIINPNNPEYKEPCIDMSIVTLKCSIPFYLIYYTYLYNDDNHIICPQTSDFHKYSAYLLGYNENFIPDRLYIANYEYMLCNTIFMLYFIERNPLHINHVKKYARYVLKLIILFKYLFNVDLIIEELKKFDVPTDDYIEKCLKIQTYLKTIDIFKNISDKINMLYNICNQNEFGKLRNSKRLNSKKKNYSHLFNNDHKMNSKKNSHINSHTHINSHMHINPHTNSLIKKSSNIDQMALMEWEKKEDYISPKETFQWFFKKLNNL